MTQQEYELCRDIGFKTGLHIWNYCKRAQAIDTFFGYDGLKAFIYGYRIAQRIRKPFEEYKIMYDNWRSSIYGQQKETK